MNSITSSTDSRLTAVPRNVSGRYWITSDWVVVEFNAQPCTV